VITGRHRTDFVQDEAGRRLEVTEPNDLRFGPDSRLWVLEAHRVRVGSVADGAPVVWRNDAASTEAGADLKCVAPGRGFTLVGRRDGRVIRLDPQGAELGSWQVMESAVLSAAVSPGESRAAAGGERGEVRLIDVAGGKVTDLPDAHRLAVRTVAYGPDFFVTGSADRRVRLWTLAGEPIATLQMRGPVHKVLVSARGDSLLVQVEGERAVRRWRLDVLFRAWAALGLFDRAE
jgi:WD40 repeat protein